MRQKLPDLCDQHDEVLFNALAEASLKEAQRTFIQLMAHDPHPLVAQRDLVLEAMAYCYGGRSERVTEPDEKNLLDGLFSSYFGHESKRIRNQRLDLLYQNKSLMIQASLAFIVIFLSFMNDPQFYVRGISVQGMEPA